MHAKPPHVSVGAAVNAARTCAVEQRYVVCQDGRNIDEPSAISYLDSIVDHRATGVWRFRSVSNNTFSQCQTQSQRSMALRRARRSCARKSTRARQLLRIRDKGNSPAKSSHCHKKQEMSTRHLLNMVRGRMRRTHCSRKQHKHPSPMASRVDLYPQDKARHSHRGHHSLGTQVLHKQVKQVVSGQTRSRQRLLRLLPDQHPGHPWFSSFLL